MPKLTNILVATDMSPRSDRAVRRAFDLARTHGLPVTVLMVLDDAMPADLTDMLHAKAEMELDRFVATLGDGVAHDIVIRVGDPTHEILHYAHNDALCLLVMGIHRPRPFLDTLRETTMQRIVRRTSNPVLLVKDAVDHSYDKVVAACDFSPASTASLKLALSLNRHAKARLIHALHVPYSGMLGQTSAAAADLANAFHKEAVTQDVAWRATADLPAGAGKTEIMPGSPYPILCGLADCGDADLIAVGAHGRVGSARAILGSLSIDLMRDPPCDVLIARP
ncbi:universal stress protein [uncultured Tateyamaria sp.]|uniref:universal stress protein n=1 Tax=Tateyamaria sp. 1078 TaxID=3417464 RepID=UPI00260C6B53|nr:universal stress protein [uncultured Tateyamaria sp.]